eukprot:GFUD01027410.1.p1 GENE.GFUD01027410.1~~GFUD01027410.1.p1  ORF type:complete len:161 (-),score=60.66 GFUD01027410.1:799-1281(-)
MADQELEIIAGVGNEVFYFFVLLVLLLVVVVAWYSTYVVEPVVQSVILVERSPVGGAVGSNQIQASSPEEVRQAVTQFLQQQPRDRQEEAVEQTAAAAPTFHSTTATTTGRADTTAATKDRGCGRGGTLARGGEGHRQAEVPQRHPEGCRGQSGGEYRTV